MSYLHIPNLYQRQEIPDGPDVRRAIGRKTVEIFKARLALIRGTP